MINEAVGKYLIFNGEIEEVGLNEYFEEITTNPLYEVITVVQGIPVFFEEHMDRLVHTAELLDLELKRSVEEIKQDFYHVISANEMKEGYIKLVISDDIHLVYQYWDQGPSQQLIDEGIEVSIFDYERANPNAKIFYTNFKAEVAKYLIQTRAYEALLRNEEGELLEGSKTNLYFTSKDKVITAPDDRVLKGITRTRLEKIFEKNNIEVEKRIIRDIDLVEVDGAFISGTTVGVLPIRSIESIVLNSQNSELIKKIIKGYQELQQEYIDERK
ncbi:MAG: aminotransferase class IV [Neofamilia sp.]